MRETTKKRWLPILALVLAAQLLAPAWPGNRAWGEEGKDGKGEALLSRIDFGNAYVMGQSIKSGAVYLLNRKKSDIQSMLDCRRDYRREIREDAEVVDTTRERFSRR
ncbi:hypothetical protein [Desulfuromonas sp.]|uniref:hypothetical protein n=1 Tax=Desulfuromonas sp. TaxID=892 RepID=UPI0025B86BEE|nr:hypothetical protein [Desulfuromonas sp.]